MDLVEETIEAYRHSFEDYEAKHMDINAVKKEADFFLSKIWEDEILDVGCGPGRDLKYFSEMGYKVTGIDLMPGFVETSRRNAPSANVYLMDMRRMGFNSDSFDGVWSMASILHLPRDPVDEAKEALEEYLRVLKSGGTMFLSAMKGNGSDPLPTSPKYGGHSKYFYGYGEQELQYLICSVGFSIDHFEVSVKPTSRKPLTFLNVLAQKY